MKQAIIWIIIILVVGAGLFWYMNRSNEPTSFEETAPQSMVISLSDQNDSGMSGTATLRAMGEQTLVTLDLSGAPEDVVQPAHIHTGSCADIGGIVYPLESPVNGVSETTLSVSLEALRDGLPLALNVHKSVEEAGVYVACGDLK